jgi:hypothetical protein
VTPAQGCRRRSPSELPAAALAALSSNDSLFECEADTSSDRPKGYYFVFSKGEATGSS